jgi:ABC-2 type transport system permease protein
VILAGWIFLDIPVKGNVFMLSLSLFIFIIGGLGWGLLISTIAQTQEAAFFIATLATLLPTQILSGFIIPIENMPRVMQWITTVVPAKYLLVVLRDILLKDAPIGAYWQSFLAIVIFACLTMSVAIKRLSKIL